MKKKEIRKKGKIPLSTLFSELKIGDKVALVRDLSFSPSFPKSWQGKTGKVIKKQGKAYVIQLKEGNKLKKINVKRINLKKL